MAIGKQPGAVPSPTSTVNPSDLLKQQHKANMMMALGDALRGKDISRNFLQRKQQMLAQNAADEQKRKSEQLLKQQEEFVKNNPQYAEMIEMNRLFGINKPTDTASHKDYLKTTNNPTPEGYLEFLNRNNPLPKLPSSSELINQKKLATLNLIATLPGSFQKRIEKLKEEHPSEYGIYKDYIEKQDSFNLIEMLMDSSNGNPNSSSQFTVELLAD